MDLCERKSDEVRRHPWELARAQSIQHILRSIPLQAHHRVLDMGCGDGFTAQQIVGSAHNQTLAGLDIHLTEEHLQELRQQYPHSLYTNDPQALEPQKFDLIFFLDVLEHIELEQQYLQDTATQFLADDGYVMITVPAFQFLFSQHDVYLKHYRRYSLGQLQRMVRGAGLIPVRQGYLFGSLLPVRFLSVLLEKIRPSRPEQETGIGQWRYGTAVTTWIKQALYLDNRWLLLLSRWGIHLPGLTSWVLCKKQPL